MLKKSEAVIWKTQPSRNDIYLPSEKQLLISLWSVALNRSTNTINLILLRAHKGSQRTLTLKHQAYFISCIYSVYLGNASAGKSASVVPGEDAGQNDGHCNVISHHIVLMRTNVIHLLNRVPEHDSLTLFVLHRTKCKPMHFE